MRANKFFLAALLGTTCFMTTAAEVNLQQEVKIAAKNWFADIKNRRVVYEGPVLVTQGQMRLNADELSASSPSKEEDRILIAKGNPATFKQKQEDGTVTTASAQEIHFNINQRLLTLIGTAKVEQNGSMNSADKIVYDLNKQQYRAFSNENEQVTTVIRPDNLPKQPTTKKQDADPEQP
ncbi:lipopolysaccharide transport periplasmic protein LptA [Shewanella sp.]|uniref:lipopolysaccharide transport periplasmic protein LptA n=1 Tax=Shewanella sp. TaxID=50422 RepID=UPI003A97B4E2